MFGCVDQPLIIAAIIPTPFVFYQHVIRHSERISTRIEVYFLDICQCTPILRTKPIEVVCSAWLTVGKPAKYFTNTIRKYPISGMSLADANGQVVQEPDQCRVNSLTTDN